MSGWSTYAQMRDAQKATAKIQRERWYDSYGRVKIEQLEGLRKHLERLDEQIMAIHSQIKVLSREVYECSGLGKTSSARGRGSSSGKKKATRTRSPSS